jgi:hypothetical protein
VIAKEVSSHLLLFIEWVVILHSGMFSTIGCAARRNESIVLHSSGQSKIRLTE